MDKKKTPEFDPELLATIAPEKREEFKRIARKKRYLASGLFLFIWHVDLWGLCFFFLYGLFKIYEGMRGALEGMFSHYSLVLFSFFLAIIFAYSTRSIRVLLNQTGLNVVHGFFISLPFLLGALWWLEVTPNRAY